ncbi:MAG: hypothetical protein AABX13_02820 [Nanoarchaeota archaeon]
MNLPTISQCSELFDQYNVPGTVRIHCETVHKVAVALAEQLLAKSYPLDLNIIKPFSLLHDFMKAVVLERLDQPPYNYTPTAEEIKRHHQLRQQYAGKSETYVAYLILKEKYPEFAQLFLELEDLTRNPLAKVHEETKFIHYVDWRVLGNRVVPLNERMKYIYQRYGKWIRRNKIDWPASRKEQQDYERKIFKLLPYKAEELGQKIQL